MTSKRLDHYGKVNRDRVVSFTWDNRKLFGYEGLTLHQSMNKFAN